MRTTPRAIDGSWLLAALVVAACLGAPQQPEVGPVYTSPEECGACHSDIARRYGKTGMARSFRAFDPETAGFALDSAAFYHVPSDRFYRVLLRDGRAYLRRHQLGWDGSEVNVVEKRIDYVMGSGNKVRTFLHRTEQGELIELPLAWYSERRGFWAMNPGYDRPDHEDFRKRIRYDCFFCHNAYPNVGDEATFYSDPIYPRDLPEGIDCQRCHGPGREHVRAARAAEDVSRIRALILNPAKLPDAQKDDVCYQCHLQSTSRALPHAVVRFGRGIFSYRPGEPLGDYAIHFRPADESNDRFEIAHSAYRLRQSPCFAAGIRCTGCHDPHAAGDGTEAARSTALCQGCHGSARSSNHPASDQHCTKCHMPQRRTDDVVHVVMTDHRIGLPGKGNLTAPKLEQAPDAVPYQGRVVPYYPESAIGPLEIAAAQVRAGANLTQGMRDLEAAIERQRPSTPEPFFEMAEAFRRAGKRESWTWYERALEKNPEFLPALRLYGTELAAGGNVAKGIASLKNAAALATDARTLHDLGVAYLLSGDRQSAMAALRQALTADPDSPETHNALAAELFAGGDIQGAEASLREAIRHRPDYGLAHTNLAILLMENGRGSPGELAYHFERAVAFEPEKVEARIGYATLLASAGRLEQAAAHLKLAREIEGDNADAAFLLGSVLEALGDTASAREAYEAAARTGDSRIREASRQALGRVGK